MNNLAQETTGYYSSVSALTPKEVQASVVEEIPAATNTQISFSLIFLPFTIFFLLFIGSVILEIIKKTATVRRIMSAFVFAFILSLTPFAAKIISYGNINSYLKAGPDEIPRNLRIRQNDDSILVSWETGTVTAGGVKIWSDDVNESRVYLSAGGKGSEDHSVIIDNIKQNKYFLEVLSGKKWYDNNGQPMLIDLP